MKNWIHISMARFEIRWDLGPKVGEQIGEVDGHGCNPRDRDTNNNYLDCHVSLIPKRARNVDPSFNGYKTKVGDTAVDQCPPREVQDGPQNTEVVVKVNKIMDDNNGD